MSIQSNGWIESSPSCNLVIQIREEFLTCYDELESMEVKLDGSAIDEDSLNSMKNTLLDIVAVYKRNVKEIGNIINDEAVVAKKMKFSLSYAENFAFIELGKIGCQCNNLAAKIERCSGKFVKFNIQAPILFTLPRPSLINVDFPPVLKKVTGVATSFTNNNTPTTQVVEEKSTTPVVVETQANDEPSVPNFGPNDRAAGYCRAPNNLAPEFTLGICCAPEWGNAPIALKANGNGVWSVLVPPGKEWKCVAMQNGEVKQWENRQDNRSPCYPAAKRFELTDVNFG